MALNILRGLFVLLMAAVGYSFVVADPETVGQFQSINWLALSASLIAATGMIILDVAAGRRKLAIFSAIAFGTLIGLVITYALSLGVALLINTFVFPGSADNPENRALISFTTLLIGCVSCYFAISFILQTKDDFRFIIPYVEFRRDARGSRPALLDTSVLIDGRIEPIVDAGFLDLRFVVPQFVIRELQRLADSENELKRGRGRRGLDVLERLRHREGADVRIYEPHDDDDAAAARKAPSADLASEDLKVDDRLVRLADELDAKLVTLDFNLAKVARPERRERAELQRPGPGAAARGVAGDAAERADREAGHRREPGRGAPARRHDGRRRARRRPRGLRGAGDRAQHDANPLGPPGLRPPGRRRRRRGVVQPLRR